MCQFQELIVFHCFILRLLLDSRVIFRNTFCVHCRSARLRIMVSLHFPRDIKLEILTILSSNEPPSYRMPALRGGKVEM